MRQAKRDSKGFVFLAVLGVMAVTILLTFAMSSATEFSYRSTGLSLFDVQQEQMMRSATNYALQLIARKKMATDGKPQPFSLFTDPVLRPKGEGTVAATEPTPADPFYKALSFAHRPGDVLVHVVPAPQPEQEVRGGRYVLCNQAGRRLRPIDVTAAFTGRLIK